MATQVAIGRRPVVVIHVGAVLDIEIVNGLAAAGGVGAFTLVVALQAAPGHAADVAPLVPVELGFQFQALVLTLGVGIVVPLLDVIDLAELIGDGAVVTDAHIHQVLPLLAHRGDLDVAIAVFPEVEGVGVAGLELIHRGGLHLVVEAHVERGVVVVGDGIGIRAVDGVEARVLHLREGDAVAGFKSGSPVVGVQGEASVDGRR
ncbi:MAG: hypothetical protein IPO28_05745 [Holophagaceae bacterium]|nr:hypothetical protein [Holophagaceae bacterium]